jgi:hypothetical protein
MSDKLIAQGRYLLQKFPGKGGWTYAAIPEVAQNQNNPFGWVKVKGHIDGFELKQYKLMPMGNGELFLPVKAAIRKIIQKEQGDYVDIELYLDKSMLEIPEEVLECFKNEPPEIFETFQTFSEGEKKAYLDWIDAAKMIDTKVKRIAKMMARLQQKLKFHEKPGRSE